MGVLFALSFPALACLLIGLAAVERMVPRLRRRKGRAISATGFDEFTAVFHGTKRVEIDQRQTSLMDRDDADAGAPPNGRIDLDGGVAYLKRTNGATG